MKNYLREGGIQLSDGGKGKRRAELLDLCQKAAAMKQRKLDDSVEDRVKLLEDKLQTGEGKLPDPKTLIERRFYARNSVRFYRSSCRAIKSLCVNEPLVCLNMLVNLIDT